MMRHRYRSVTPLHTLLIRKMVMLTITMIKNDDTVVGTTPNGITSTSTLRKVVSVIMTMLMMSIIVTSIENDSTR